MLNVRLRPSLSMMASSIVVLGFVGISMAADEKSRAGESAKSTKTEKSSGVILKAQPIPSKDGSSKQMLRLTINTDVAWRDFVRDQAVGTSKAAHTGTQEAASKGKESVATEGHPRDRQLLFTVDIDAKTEITMKYRSSTDSIGEGAATAEEASQAESITRAPSGATTPEPDNKNSQRQAMKPKALKAMDLKPGLWVDVDFLASDKAKQACRIAVLRPVGGADTPADKLKSSKAPGR